jgi:mannosyltransferase OCH1-like enzyme
MLVNKRELIKKQQQKQQEFQDSLKEKIQNNIKIINYNNLIKPFVFKKMYNTIIPLHLYTCWHTKDLPPLMKANYDFLMKSNPKITFHLYNENECREFIRMHFEFDVLDAYDRLIPCSYKSDLWRYCVLFIKGGIYLDIKYKPNNNFRFINLTESEHFCFDIDGSNIYNAIMVCKQGNLSCLTAIRQIVKHVNMHYYGNSALDPTGPRLLARCITQNNKFNIDMKHGLIHHNFENRYIKWNDYYILHQYKGYLDESAKYAKTNHYSAMWSARQIYN